MLRAQRRISHIFFFFSRCTLVNMGYLQIFLRVVFHDFKFRTSENDFLIGQLKRDKYDRKGVSGKIQEVFVTLSSHRAAFHCNTVLLATLYDNGSGELLFDRKKLDVPRSVRVIVLSSIVRRSKYVFMQLPRRTGGIFIFPYLSTFTFHYQGRFAYSTFRFRPKKRDTGRLQSVYSAG